MLEIVKFNEDEYSFPCLIVLGCFDGIHSGHADLLKKARLQAKINGLDLGVMMFSEGKGGRQVYTFDERISFLEQFNVKFVIKVDFNDEFKDIKPLDFLKILEETTNVKAYMSGKDFRFGAGAKGKSSTLKSYCEDEDNGVWYMPVKDVTYGEEKISTSIIKSMLSGGDIKLANELLGRNFSVTGTVVNGASRGGELLGFPTMNIVYPENKVEIKQGVYSVQCTIGENVYRGVANYGPRPTFGEDKVLLEVHLAGFDGSNYGEKITVEFINYLREITAFGSAEELRDQLSKDLAGLDEVTAAVEELAAAEDKPQNEAKTQVETADSQTQVETAEEAEFEAELNEEVTEEPVQEAPAEETTEEPVQETSEEVEEPVQEVSESEENS